MGEGAQVTSEETHKVRLKKDCEETYLNGAVGGHRRGTSQRGGRESLGSPNSPASPGPLTWRPHLALLPSLPPSPNFPPTLSPHLSNTWPPTSQLSLSRGPSPQLPSYLPPPQSILTDPPPPLILPFRLSHLSPFTHSPLVPSSVSFLLAGASCFPPGTPRWLSGPGRDMGAMGRLRCAQARSC